MSNNHHAVISGVLEKISSRKPQGFLMYDITVEGKSYGCGPVRPQVEEGSRVTFEVERKGAFLNVKKGTLRPWEPKDDEVIPAKALIKTTETVAPTSKSERAKATGPAPMTKDDYWRNKEKDDVARQDAIQFQAACNRALEMLKLLVQAGALYPDSVKKPAERHELIAAKEEDLIRKYFNQVNARDSYREVPIPVVTQIVGNVVTSSETEVTADEKISEEYLPPTDNWE